MKVKTANLIDGDLKFSVTLIEIENAVLAFYSATDSPKLGTIAIAIP
jgi:hypothetical protein